MLAVLAVMRLAGFSLTCFRLHGDHTGTQVVAQNLTGIQLQEPSLALVTVRDWLRMHLCDRDIQVASRRWRYAGAGEEAIVYSTVWIARRAKRESCSICLRCWEITALA